MDDMPTWGWVVFALPIVAAAWWYLGKRVGIGAALAAAVAVFGAQRHNAGRAKAEAEQKRAEDQAYIDTRERMDDADIVGDDPHLSREWLRERAQRKPDRDL